VSVSRHCEFWKASDGKWYMDLAVNEYYDDDDDGESYGRPGDGDYEDSITYGPFPSQEAADAYLTGHFSNPGVFSEDDSGKRAPPTKSPNGSPVQRPGIQRSSAYRGQSADDMIAATQVAMARQKPIPKTPSKTYKVYGSKSLKGPGDSVRKVAVHTRVKGKTYGPQKTSRFKKGDDVSVRPSTYAGLAKDNKTPYQVDVNDPDESGQTQHWNVDKSDIGESVLHEFISEVLNLKR
jgi:hypothetical protein